MDIKYLTKDGAPYRGYADSILREDGTVAYTDGLTRAQYEAREGCKFTAHTYAEICELDKAYHASRVTAPTEISAERFDEMLNILPPEKWGTVRGVNMFHMCERISGPLVDWFAKIGDRYFHCVDVDSADRDALADKFGAMVKQ